MSHDAAAQAGYRPGLSQVPLSALEHFDYCPRQAGLILLEDGFADDAATIRASLALQVQEHASVENALLGQLAEQMTAEDMHALAVAYQSAWSDDAALATQPEPAHQ